MICLWVYLLCIQGGGSHDFKEQKFKAHTQNMRGGLVCEQTFSIQDGCWVGGKSRLASEACESASGLGIGEEPIILRGAQIWGNSLGLD